MLIIFISDRAFAKIGSMQQEWINAGTFSLGTAYLRSHLSTSVFAA